MHEDAEVESPEQIAARQREYDARVASQGRIYPGSERHRENSRPAMNARLRPRAEVIINAQVVKDRRKRLGLSQVQLGIMSATSPRTIAQIERGKSLDPPTSTTLRIAKALSVSVEALTSGALPYTSRTVAAPVHDPEAGR